MRITLFIEEFDQGVLYGEGLSFPSRAAMDHKISALERSIRERTLGSLETISPVYVSQSVDGAEAHLEELDITFAPAEPSASWSEELTLSVPLVRRLTGRHHVIHFPTLGLTVLGEAKRSSEEMAARVKAEVRQYLRRKGLGSDLLALAYLQRKRSVRLHTLELQPTVPTPWERYQKEQKGRGPKPILEEVATHLDPRQMSQAFEVTGTVRRLAEALNTSRASKGGKGSAGGNGSVLLVGPSGAGKTALFHELVRRYAELGLERTQFYSASGARLVAGQSGFGMWQERCQQLIDEVKGKPVVFHFGNLKELMQVGKSSHNQQGIASFLRPAIARGQLTVVLEATPDQMPGLEKEDPNFLSILRRFDVSPPNAEKTRTILRSIAPKVDPEAIDRIEALHRRYAAYSAVPGRPVRFLKRLLGEYEAQDFGTLGTAEVVAAFSAETGLPRFMLDDDMPLELLKLRYFFLRRVMGQDEVIDRILGLLALIKTRLSRPGKPLVSLLFIGPTGVGKTEVAKALAAFLFGDEGRLTRFDMSEYSDPGAARRLVGGMGGGEGLLTSRMRQQPFSVLLFDEFEKAHAGVYDLFLQMLGEARLTDQAGRTADFRNAVILLTSNLGAETFSSGGVGFQSVHSDLAARAREHFETEVQKFLRPEMVNRIDAIIPFDPLPMEVALEVTRKEFARARRRPGFDHRLPEFTPSDELIWYLTERGFDPRYGGRPLKRAIERDFLTPLATGFSAYPDTDEAEFEFSCEVPESEGAGPPTAPLKLKVWMKEAKARGDGAENLRCRELADVAMRRRREVDRLTHCDRVNQLRSRVDRLLLRREKIEKRRRKGKKVEPLSHEDEQWFFANVERLARLDRLLEDTERLEDDLVTGFVQQQEMDADWAVRLELIPEQAKEWMRETYLSMQTRPNQMRLAIYGDGLLEHVRMLIAAVEMASGETVTWSVGRLVRRDSVADASRCAGDFWDALPYADPAQFERTAQQVKTGIIVTIRGPLAGLYLNAEGGLHTLIRSEEEKVKRVVHTLSEIGSYTPPEDLERKGFINRASKCRTYHLGIPRILHHPSQVKLENQGGLIELLGLEMKTRLERRILRAFT